MVQASDPGVLGATISTIELEDNSVTDAKIAAHTTTKITVPYSQLSALAIVNADIDAGAAIASSKLAAAPLMSVLGDYEATVAENSHTFNFTAVDFDDDSYLMLVIDGSVSGALNLLLQINLDTGTNYETDARRVSGGSEVLINLNGQNGGQIASSTMLAGNLYQINSIVIIQLSKAGSEDKPGIQFSSNGITLAAQEVGAIRHISIEADYTDIRIFTSANNWAIGTRMTIYKVARA